MCGHDDKGSANLPAVADNLLSDIALPNRGRAPEALSLDSCFDTV